MRAAVPLLLLAAVACRGSEREASPTPPAPSPSASATTASPTPTPPVVVEREDVGFSTPTKNIGCYISLLDNDDFVSCDVAEHTWPLPPEPSGCEYDWGATLQVAQRGPATVGACHSDTTLGAERILAYGTALRAGGIECVSRTTGLTCRSLETGHGFEVSRAAYRLF